MSLTGFHEDIACLYWVRYGFGRCASGADNDLQWPWAA